MADDPAPFGDIGGFVDEQLNRRGAQEVRFGGMVIRVAQNQQVKSFVLMFSLSFFSLFSPQKRLLEL